MVLKKAKYGVSNFCGFRNFHVCKKLFLFNIIQYFSGHPVVRPSQSHLPDNDNDFQKCDQYSKIFDNIRNQAHDLRASESLI